MLFSFQKGGEKLDFFIKQARQKAQLSQKALALQLGISPATLSGYENGDHDPKSEILSQIASICHVSVDFLLGREKSPTPSDDDAGDKLAVEEVIAAFVAAGIVPEGQDLSDEDLKFFSSILAAVSQWFAA